MRVIIANPPGYGGPDYDDHLCGELGRLGADVELVTSRFRFGDVPQPSGYRRTELFYPLSSRLFRRSRLRIPLKLAELCDHCIRIPAKQTPQIQEGTMLVLHTLCELVEHDLFAG